MKLQYIFYISIAFLFFINTSYGQACNSSWSVRVDPTSPYYNCSEYFNTPCPDIQTALNAFEKARTSFMRPNCFMLGIRSGVYSGVNNTNLKINNGTFFIRTWLPSDIVTIDLQNNGSFFTITDDEDTKLTTSVVIRHMKIINASKGVLSVNTTHTITNVTIENMTLTHNDAEQSGGLITVYSKGIANVKINFTSSTVVDNYVPIFISESDRVTLILNNTIIENNNINYDQLILSANSNITVNNLTLSSNSANQTLLTFNNNPQVNIYDLKVYNNKIRSNSSLLSIFGGSIANINSSRFVNNVGGSAIEYGSPFGLMNITNTTFQANTDTDYGGAIYVLEDSNVAIYNSSFIENSAILDAGAIYFEGANSTIISNSTFKDNSAGSLGFASAIYLDNVESGVYLSHVSFYNNTSNEKSTPIFCDTSVIYINKITSNVIDNSIMSCKNDCTIKGDYEKSICSSKKERLSPGAVAGIIIGVIAGVFIIIVVLFAIKKRDRLQYQIINQNNYGYA